MANAAWLRQIPTRCLQSRARKAYSASFASAISILRNSASVTVFEEVTIRLPCRPVGIWPRLRTAVAHWSSRSWQWGLPRHQKCLQHAILDQVHAPRRLTFRRRNCNDRSVAGPRSSSVSDRRRPRGSSGGIGLPKQLGKGLTLFIPALPAGPRGDARGLRERTLRRRVRSGWLGRCKAR